MRKSIALWMAGLACLVFGSSVVARQIRSIDKAELELDVFRPKVIDAAETMVKREDRLTVGVQTWVNLDNDDGDKNFDLEDDDVAGDDELIRAEVNLKPPAEAGGVVRITIDRAPESLKFWKESKKTALELPLTLKVPQDFAVGPNGLKAMFYIEGVKPSNRQREVTLTATFNSKTFVKESKAAITVLGVKGFEWIGQKNSHEDKDALDKDTNWNEGAAGYPGVRVFPDARRDGAGKMEATARDKVTLIASLNVKPVEPVKLSLRAFDIDDPSTDKDYVDPNDDGKEGDYEDAIGPVRKYDKQEDNRGLADGERAGKLKDQDNATKILTTEFKEDKKEIEFTTSMQPGDNYRVVANGDPKFLKELRNEDKFHAYRVVDPRIGNDAAAEIREQKAYGSPCLTVWRICNYEIDSQGKVKDNFKKGQITGTDGKKSDEVVLATVDINFTTNDGTKTYSDGLVNGEQPRGRFDRGRLNVAGIHDINPIDGNGNSDLRKAAKMNLCATKLPVVLRSMDGSKTMTANVTSFTATPIVLSMTDFTGGPLNDDFKGGTASIAGGDTMNITKVEAGKVEVSRLRIPFTVYDDDMDNGTEVPDPNVDHLNEAFKPAYVVFRKESEGNQGDLPFVANATASWTDSWNISKPEAELEIDRYWLVYIYGAFQYLVTSDNDYGDDDLTKGEDCTWGIVDGVPLVTGRGRGTSIYSEVIRPKELKEEDKKGRGEKYTASHEVGHLFGGRHDEIGGNNSGLNGLMDQTPSRQGNVFINRTLNKIRGIDHP